MKLRHNMNRQGQKIPYQGKMWGICELAIELGISQPTMYKRIKEGKTIEEIKALRTKIPEWEKQ